MDFFQLPSFQLNLSAKIEHVTSGRFEENATSLVCSTEGGKVLIYTPHTTFEEKVSDIAEGSSELRTLSINGKVTGLISGKLNKDLSHDILAIGMETTLRAYDVVLNSDTYFVTIHEGVNCISLHSQVEGDELQIFAAGNGAVRGYNKLGEESAWLLSGEDVVSMCSYNAENGDHGLLVATANSRVQFFKRDEMSFAISETDDVCAMVSLARGYFGFQIGENTAGVYHDSLQMWRHTYPSPITAIASFDCDNDGENELIIALQDGTLEARRGLTGEVLSAGKIEDGSVVAMTKWETVIGEKPRLAICTRNGLVKGYKPSTIALPDIPPVVKQALTLSNDDEESIGHIALDSTVAEMAEFLSSKKASLEKQIAEMEEIVKATKKKTYEEANAIPAKTTIRLFCKTNESTKQLEAHCSTNNDVTIRGLILFSDILYPQGSYFKYCDPPQQNVHLSIMPPKCKPLTITAKVIAGNRSSDMYHVFDATLTMKRFPLHVCVNETFPLDSYVQFVLMDRIERVALWLGTAFPLVVKETKITEMNVNFRCFGDANDPLSIAAFNNPTGGIRVMIYGMSMETVSEVAQDMFDYFKVTEMESLAYFPKEMEAFKATLRRVVDLNHLRMQLTADIAERTSSAKVAIVKAEDARLIGDMVSMKEWLGNLDTENKELLKGYLIRKKNHEELLVCLKEVNKVIQFASRFRRGKAQQRVITESRLAIKENRLEALNKIVETGSSQAR
ncbi:putative Bardet-Biedl syndrome 2 protein [Monocercomonoides exilis]|uniref:putative Bardet-Biedl syndrome 2 protein n=1 Tax=Monocercomonoides exilis TaxID=2049356 RepID=UPI00355A05D4|nr:putative Bardet-Biedl syndrome 2 protein [Monocercomonoides exilis]|eukprot:MONOS_8494.1-p1 / transcript=MONOS_8494.1 / gene=MONOS_8494 / organism=Monocercomonoides_exilis_PA203 / gene_product=Bardet-Biedl syndrome 2-like protein / transcript_product=Bardet-Biedl syndrome 2-like protein / location=Mono_scaffold00321:35660-39408(-) / protein_length=732 / sequence_SO=supercontig / SO=protein_coding / is_pseudo=false